jgi:hypothetical protein
MKNCPCCNTIIEKSILSLNLSLVNDIGLNNTLVIRHCIKCNFYYTDSNNNQTDYDNYYKTFNNYSQQNYCINKDEKCVEFLLLNINNNPTSNILDYGSGNGMIAKLLSPYFNVDKFDIDIPNNNKQYDLVILSHVLEHIYDLDTFIRNVSLHINNTGLIYIEIPNAEFYDKMIDICPLQEINIEHINFFSKFALNKLMIKHNFYPIKLEDDYFMLNNNKYYIIRSIFKKYNNNSFINYIENGQVQLKTYNFTKLNIFNNIYLYSCGQFLFKIFNEIEKNCKIINIVDDNTTYFNKKINNIPIINFDIFKNSVLDNDTILLTTMIHDNAIRYKLSTINKKINIITLAELLRV